MQTSILLCDNMILCRVECSKDSEYCYSGILYKNVLLSIFFINENGN